MEGDGNCFFRAVRHFFSSPIILLEQPAYSPNHAFCRVLCKTRVVNDTVLDNLSNDPTLTNDMTLLGKRTLVRRYRLSPRLEK